MGLLVVAATEPELAGAGAEPRLACGIGPRAAFAATRAALAGGTFGAVLHVGIAGARRGSGIALLDVVVGTAAIDCDAEPPARLEPDGVLAAAALAAVAGAVAAPIGTSARVGGTSAVAVEAMEGFAVLAAARAAGVPAVEVRVVSNEIEEADRERWLFAQAFARLADVTSAIADELGRRRGQRESVGPGGSGALR